MHLASCAWVHGVACCDACFKTGCKSRPKCSLSQTLSIVPNFLPHSPDSQSSWVFQLEARLFGHAARCMVYARGKMLAIWAILETSLKKYKDNTVKYMSVVNYLFSSLYFMSIPSQQQLWESLVRSDSLLGNADYLMDS